jgi:hypothetical protein
VTSISTGRSVASISNGFALGVDRLSLGPDDLRVHEVDELLLLPHDTPGFRNAVLADAQGAVFSLSVLTMGR